MEWADEMPTTRALAARRRYGVKITASSASGRRPLVTITFSVPEFDGCALMAARTVKVRRGIDGARQVLRLEAGAACMFGHGGGRNSTAAKRVLLPRPAWLPTQKLHAICEFDYSTDWIEVELPEWFKAPQATAAPVPPRAEPPARAPFVPLIPNQPRRQPPRRLP